MPAETANLTGALGEMMFERHFFGEGRFMAIPRFDLHKVDFVLEWEGQLIKVQVKTMSPLVTERGRHYIAAISSSRKGYKTRQPYQEGEVDYFGIVNLDYEHIWMVPFKATENKRSLNWIPPGYRKRRKPTAFNWDPYRIK